MLLREVQYARPASVDDAVRLLAGNENARALAGGQTLINVMKARVASPDALVDLNGIEGLRGIRGTPDGGLEVGAMATCAELMLSAEVAERRPILAEVAAQIADVQVRNRGTIGGNVCSSDPTNHFPPVLVALDAGFTIAGERGERTVAAEDFFVGVYVTAVAPGELLTAITVPAAGAARDAFASVTIGEDGTCIVNAAATVDGGRARIAIGCVAAAPVVVACAAEEPAVREAVRAAGLEPPADVHGSAEYRRHLAGIVAVRAVRAAVGRPG